MTDMQLRELTEQRTVAVRVQVPMSEVDMAALFGRYLPLVGGYLAAAGVAPAGAPFGRYHRWDDDAADVEIGIPVRGGARGDAGARGRRAGRAGHVDAARRARRGRGACRFVQQPQGHVRRAARLDPRPGPRGGQGTVGVVRRRSREDGPRDPPNGGRLAGALTSGGMVGASPGDGSVGGNSRWALSRGRSCRRPGSTPRRATRGRWRRRSAAAGPPVGARALGGNLLAGDQREEEAEGMQVEPPPCRLSVDRRSVVVRAVARRRK